jgi:hypothetical protein
MNDDELKKLWRQQPLRDPDVSGAQLVSAMQSKTTPLRRALLARDLRELVACAFVIIIFGIFYFTLSHTPMSRLGDLIVIGSSIFTAWKLVYARRTTTPAPPGATVVESLRAELNAVRAQSQLLRSILGWYLLPTGIGIFVCTWGSFTGGLGGLVFNIIYTLGVIALYACIYRLNQRARAKQLLPVEAQLQSLLRSVETGEPLEAAQAANLHPIALSMAAADQVKPAEFKVAFWQIALWGEVGFIGGWFLLMVGLTLGNAEKGESWRTKAPAREPIAQGFHFDETNRYSVVARKVVELFNAGDYAAVQKLYNPAMREVFPPKATSDFYTRLAKGFGKIENLEGPTGNGFRGWTAVRLHCQRGELTMSLTLDADDKIAGIHFQPAPRPSRHSEWPVPRIEWVVRRVFSSQHLVWIVPFFLAGLLYSWLLQKTTERAVGISTLGVHLCKGQNLILWDEIKEVRPLRILNMRSLWLVRESGAKTIMPWTSLERHSDLKAAVQGFGPANHPIRKHLSLL